MKTELSGVFEREYARVAVLEATDTQVANRLWLCAQATVLKLKEADPLGWWRDYYLLILVSQAAVEEWAALREISDNTFVCRKLCEVVGARSLREVLMKSPILNAEGPQMLGTPGAGVLPATESTHLPEMLLHDLSTRSRETILRKLLDGVYGSDMESS